MLWKLIVLDIFGGIYSCINHRTNFTIKLVLTSCQKMGSTILFLINLLLDDVSFVDAVFLSFKSGNKILSFAVLFGSEFFLLILEQLKKLKKKKLNLIN